MQSNVIGRWEENARKDIKTEKKGEEASTVQNPSNVEIYSATATVLIKPWF